MKRDLTSLLSGATMPGDQAHSFVQSQLHSGEPQVAQYNPQGGWDTAKAWGQGLAGLTTPGAVADAAGYLGQPSMIENWKNGDKLSAVAQGAGVALPGFGKLAAALVPAVKLSDRTLRKVSQAKIAEGKISGAPLGVNSSQAEAARRGNYKSLVETGMAGRHWYDDSGKAIIDHVGGNVPLANQVAETGAITSASTGVDPNTQFMIRGHNQAMAGDPIATGRYPTAMGAQVNDVYRGEGAATGAKRSPFADQIAIGGNYYVKPDGQGHRGVHDIWDGEAWGYVKPDGTPLRRAFQENEHNWMDGQMDRVISDLNRDQVGGHGDWTPGNAQAAAWSGAKIAAGKLDPEGAAISYADIIPKNYAQGSRETVTGREWADPANTSLGAPRDVKDAYAAELHPAIYDETGRDRIASGYGMLTGKSFNGPGVFEGQVNPGTQTQVAVSRAVGSQDMGASDHKLMQGIESTYGLLGGQDAAAYHSFSPAKVPLNQANRAGINLGRTVNDDEMLALSKHFQTLAGQRGVDPQALVPSPTGVRMLDMNSNPQQFTTDAREAARVLGIDPKGSVNFGRGDGGYISQNDFGAGSQGSGYVRNIQQLENDRRNVGLASGFDASAPGIAKAWMEADRKFGFKPDNQLLETIRKAVADNGYAGLEELIRRGAIPMAVAAMIAPAYLGGGGQPAAAGSQSAPEL
jgi:hypothetical protein